MVVPVTISGKDSGIDRVSGELYSTARGADQTTGQQVHTIYLTPTRDFLTAEDDPVLAELWDNEDDAAYDSL